MRDYFYYYRQYIYLTKPTNINELKIGGFYRLYIYKYEETQLTESYAENHTPILMIIGYNPIKRLYHCIKINQLPLTRFIKLLEQIQNPAYTEKLIEEIEAGSKNVKESDYTTGAKAIKIDKTGKGFYKKTVKRTKDLERYDTYRTYKKNNIRRIKELYFDLNKLKKRIGYGGFTTLND